jgi:hypothetical protein
MSWQLYQIQGAVTPFKRLSMSSLEVSQTDNADWQLRKQSPKRWHRSSG